MARTQQSTDASTTTSGPAVRIYLVRHGETRENREGIIQGQRDTLLNEEGREQARAVGEALKEVRFDAAFSSDLSRAVETAEAILAHHPGIQLVKEQELRERFMGYLEGKSGMEANLRLAVAMEGGPEGSAAFAQRATSWWRSRVAGHAVGKGLENVLVTTHGGFIVTLVRELIGSRRVVAGPGIVVWRCPNASVTVIELQANGKGALVRYGDASHLAQPALESNVDIHT
ncbi:unnamed protein product [Cyclocybe aegerita]|uniref:Phosphoglycerate mutase n=1 Tax=Cyclocybe aegerita TaxID=1973307 RepID=A0A8S0Y0Z4_CYCAE|nr:unnamed protein product [Cyclocybe aegerita]